MPSLLRTYMDGSWRKHRRQISLILLGVSITAISLAGLSVFALSRLGLTRQGFENAIRTFVYRNVEWLGPLALAGFVLLLWVVDHIDMREPFFHVPFEASWWENMVFGATTVLLSLLWVITFFGGLLLTGVILPFKVAREYILGPGSSITMLIVSVPLVVVTTSLVLSFLLFVVISNGKGSLSGHEGGLLESRLGGHGGGGWDLLNVYYFTCLALLGAGFGEYTPSGYCRPITVAAVILGRLLEWVVIAIGVSIFVNRMGTP